jgi:hypothetical protein
MAELVIKLVNGELAGKTAQTIAKEINAAAQAAKKAEVGTKQWIDAHARLDNAKKLQEDLKKQIDSTKSASDQLKNAWNLLPGAGFFNQIGQSFGALRGGVGGLVSSFGVLKAAIAATGIGLLVIAVATLVDWFRKTDEGATLLGGIMRGLGAVMDKLYAGVRALTGGLVEAAKNPKQAFQDFVDFLKDQVINRINSFGVAIQGIKKIMSGEFAQGFKDLADANIQFTLGITNGTDKLMKFGQEIAKTVTEGIDLETTLDAIADRARELSVLQAQTEKDVSRLLLQSKNVSLSYEDRIALLDKASALEKANHTEQLKNAQALEAALQRDYEQKLAVGKVTDEVDQQLKDAQIARINLEKESINLQEKIENRRQQLLEKRQAELDKETERIRKAEQDRLKIVQEIEDLQMDAKDSSREKDIQALEIHARRQIESLDRNSVLYDEHVAAITNNARAKRAEINRQWDEKDQKDGEEAIQKELKARQDGYEAQQVALLQNLVDGNISRSQFDQIAQENQIRFLDDQMAILAEKGLQETELYRQLQEQKLQITLENEAKIKEARKATFDAIVSFANTALDAEIANIQRQNEAAAARVEKVKEQYGAESLAYKTAQKDLEIERKKNGERIKKFEKQKVRINLFSELANIWMNAQQFGFPYNLIIGGILSAAAIVRSNQNMKAIETTQFQDGGLLSGPSHSEGGIPGRVGRRPIEMEGGEFIFSRKAVAALGADNLSRVNDFHTFATGGPVDPFSASRSGSPSATSQPTSTQITQDGSVLNQKLDQVIVELRSWPKKLKVINVVTETEDGIKTVNQIRDDADV